MNKHQPNQIWKLIKGLLLGLSYLALNTANAQTENLNALTKGLENYKKTVLQEKIFLHTDKESYLAGESMWFKIYNVDGEMHKPTAISKVAYVEILSRDSEPVLQAKIALEEGMGKGSFQIPATLESGNYLVRAYTNWMKNFSADLFFQKPITVVNTFIPLNANKNNTAFDYDVQFFPEGGNLVNGLKSVVAFKAENSKGESTVFKGILLNQSNDTLTTFSTHKFGIGRFSFTPVAGHQYRAILTSPDGQTLTRVLPKALERGHVPELKNTDNENLHISVRTNILAPAPYFHTLYLLAHSNKKAIIAQVSHPNTLGETVFIVPKSKIGEGITHFTVFDANKRPVSERLYFKRPEQLLNLTANTDKEKFSTRSEVNLNLSADSNIGGTITDLSVAVFRKDSLNTLKSQSLASYLWLSSELKGVIEEPDYYLNQTGPVAELAQDNLMLTHGWSRFNWNEHLDGRTPSFTYLPEYGGHQIRAQVLDASTKRPTSKVQAYLASPSKYVRLYTAESNSDGYLLFDVMNFYGPQTLVLQSNIAKDSAYIFKIESPFSITKPTYKLPSFELSKQLEPVLLASSIHLQVQNYHTAGNAYKYILPRFDNSAFYGTPDKSYLLDDFTRFPVMEEVMREYVQPVMVRKRQGKFHFFVINQPQTTIFDSEPMILLDGVPVFDTDKIMALDPRKVQRLDVVSRKYYHGNNTFNGLVSYTTYDGNLAGFELDPKALLQDYEGMQLEREFYSPIYASDEQRVSRTPDLRNLLYWNPDVSFVNQENLKFYTSDQVGTYQVIIHGLSKDGKAGTAEYTFKVE